nr:hypothetical protein [Tanacetum cinerariifolium]
MTSEEIRHKPYLCPTIEINLLKATNKPRNSLNHSKGFRIKVQSPSSASVGVGKRSNSSTISTGDALAEVLDRIYYDKGISKEMTFRKGIIDSIKKSSVADKYNSDVENSGKQMVTDCDITENDGSFINDPLSPVSVIHVEQDLRSDKV